MMATGIRVVNELNLCVVNSMGKVYMAQDMTKCWIKILLCA